MSANVEIIHSRFVVDTALLLLMGIQNCALPMRHPSRGEDLVLDGLFLDRCHL